MRKGRLSRKNLKDKVFNTRLGIVGLLTTMIISWPACGSANGAYDTMASSSIAYTTSTDSYSGGMGNSLLADGKLYDEEDRVVAEKAESSNSSKSESSGQESELFDERKLIKTVNMDVETKEYDRLMTELKSQVLELGGYIESMDTYNGSSYSHYRSSRSANMTIRIPKDKLDSFLDTVAGISNVVRRSDNVEDVTLAYVDMESRKKALETEQDRLLELLQRAESINDIIVLEERLSDVRYQLESMESQLRTIDNQVDYSTIYLDISEVQELTPIVEQTPVERIGEGFVESLQDIGDGAVEFIVWFLVNIPYFVVWAVIITIIVLIVRACRKKSRAKKAQRLQSTQSVQRDVTGEDMKNDRI